ncbi:MAG: phosphoglycerate mutase family protein [Acidimicrobiales bacterium]|nr:phosphoglycerate mutase family protein [Acidimicrobiales bacterium]
MTRILLVRHGESTWNADGRWQGQADPPLTDRGRRQAALAARAIGSVDAIVASDLERALDTATVIAAELGLEPVLTEPRLRERDAGEFSGLTRVEIHARFPGLLPDDPAGAELGPDGRPRRPPGWEPDDAIWERVEVALLALGRLVPDGDIVAVTHGGVIYAMEEHLGSPQSGRLANLDGRWVRVDGDRFTLGDRVSLLEPAEATTIERDRI